MGVSENGTPGYNIGSRDPEQVKKHEIYKLVRLFLRQSFQRHLYSPILRAWHLLLACSKHSKQVVYLQEICRMSRLPAGVPGV